MTPDNWHRAMHNEADAIPDPAWAADTRRSARRARLSRLLVLQMQLQTLLVVMALLPPSPAEPGPWLALGALALSLRALRGGEVGRAWAELGAGWAALASAPGAEVLLGVALPPGWGMLLLAVLGIGAWWDGGRPSRVG